MGVLGNRGSLQILLLIIVFLITLSGLGTWGLMRRWRHLVQAQLGIDRCVGMAAIQLRDHLNEIDRLNARIKALRRSILVASTTAASQTLIPSLKLALQASYLKQEKHLKQWQWFHLRWMFQVNCGEIRNQKFPLPTLKYSRLPPDHIGPQFLQWLLPDEKFYVSAKSLSRSSHAVVSKNKTPVQIQLDSKTWRTSWCERPGFTWPSFN